MTNFVTVWFLFRTIILTLNHEEDNLVIESAGCASLLYFISMAVPPVKFSPAIPVIVIHWVMVTTALFNNSWWCEIGTSSFDCRKAKRVVPNVNQRKVRSTWTRSPHGYCNIVWSYSIRSCPQNLRRFSNLGIVAGPEASMEVSETASIRRKHPLSEIFIDCMRLRHEFSCCGANIPVARKLSRLTPRPRVCYVEKIDFKWFCIFYVISRVRPSVNFQIFVFHTLQFSFDWAETW